MHMNAPITSVVRTVMPIMSGLKMRGSEIAGSGGRRPALSWRCLSNQTGLSATLRRIHNVKSAGTTHSQNMARQAKSGLLAAKIG